MGRTGDSLEDNSPHEVGEEALSERCSLSGGKRGDPRVRWLLLLLLNPINSLNPLISLKIIIVEPGGPRPGVFAWDLCTFHQRLMKIHV